MRELMIRSGVTDLITIIVTLALPFIPLWTAIASHKLIDELDTIFSRSSFVRKDIAWMRGFEVVGEVMYCSSIFALCINWRFSIRRGWIIESEVLAVSKRQKMILYPPFIACWVWMLALIACKLLIWGPIKGAREVGL
jgi:hypothetical protein